MRYIQATSRSEIKLFPEVENWVSQHNPIRLIDLIVEKTVYSNPDNFIWKGEANTGRKSYSPATMLKLLLYGYLNKIASSRRMEAETYRNVELMWLLGELHPDHWTICEYRRNNEKHIRFVTIEFRKFLKAEGYIDGKEVATDGSKFKAYASKDMLSLKNIEKRLDKVNEKLNEYLEEVKKADTIEELTEEFAENFEGIDINKELINKIADLQEQVSKLESQKQQLESSGKNYLAPNDPDANLMRSRDGKIPAYNVQTVVDKKHRMIATSEVTCEPNDIGELKNNLDALAQQLDIIPETAEADTGYANTNQIKEIEENTETECFIPLPKNHSREEDKKAEIEFTYDEQNDEYHCSQGKTLKLKQKNKKQTNQIYKVYQCTDCNDCPLREKCTKSKTGRIYKRNVNQDWLDSYKKRMQEDKSKEKILERKTVVEHPFGTIKWMMGKFHFLLTRKKKVQIEIDLYATAYNFKRLLNIDTMDLLMQKAENYPWKRA
jgi:transposase